MARGFSQAPGASVEVLDAARRGLHRTNIALLAQSRNRVVRETIARRDDVPLGIQALLAQDGATEVRVALAANTHTVRSVLEDLSSDRSRAVLTALLTNPSVSFDIVDGLTRHRRSEVRRLASARLNDAVPLARLEDPRDEDARFPELRERGTTAAVAEESSPPPSPPPSHGAAMEPEHAPTPPTFGFPITAT